MKIRSSFVSNSSSSSFVIAFRKDCTFEDIQLIFKMNKTVIDDACSYFDYLEDGEIDLEVADAMDFLWKQKEDGLELDNWIVTAHEYSNEDDLAYAILYDLLVSIETEKFKSKAT